MAYSLAFLPDGLTLASGGHDETVRLWDIQEGTKKTILSPNFGVVKNVHVCRQGKTVVAACNGGVYLYDVAEGMKRDNYPVSSRIDIAPDGKMLALASYDTLDFRDLETGVQKGTLSSAVRAASPRFSPDGKTLAVFGDNGIVEIWDIN